MTNSCLVCNSPAAYFFNKKYPSYPGCHFSDDLCVEYYKCQTCGFAFSKTHQEMEKADWIKLNNSWHHAFESGLFGKNINQPPYANMALATKILVVNGLVNMTSSIDYAAGYGSFAKILKKYFNEIIYKYDPYVTGGKDDFYIETENLKQYDFVANSAMFEHILTRTDIDAVNSLVSNAGVMMIHTQIRQDIPCDPTWFYLEPHVHSAFFTNKAMAILMEQWGYGASLYSPEARVWFLFKRNHANFDKIESIATRINKELQRQYFHFKVGFMDYWK
jgi:hypothetical protein